MLYLLYVSFQFSNFWPFVSCTAILSAWHLRTCLVTILSTLCLFPIINWTLWVYLFSFVFCFYFPHNLAVFISVVSAGKSCLHSLMYIFSCLWSLCLIVTFLFSSWFIWCLNSTKYPLQSFRLKLNELLWWTHWF